MKTKITIIAVIALIISACSTGSHVTTSNVDDIYFNPGDIPPPVAVSDFAQQDGKNLKKSGERIIISEIRENDEGTRTMNNHIYDGQNAGSYADAQMYNMNQMELEGSDTTIYYDDNDIKYVINNYYDGSDIDFGYRIRRFHRPYFYNPFYFNDYYWNDYYSPYSSISWSMGWGGWYGGYGGYGYSPYYSSWYSPYSYYGWGGYGGWGGYYGSYYGGWGSPYYSYWGSPYYNNYYGGGQYYNSDNYTYGKRRDYNTSAVYGAGRNVGGRTSAINTDRGGLKSTSPSNTGVTESDSRRSRSVSGVSNDGRNAVETNRGGTLTEMRRGAESTESTRPRSSGTSVDRNATGTSTQGVQQRSTTPGQTGGVQTQSPATRRYSGTTPSQYTRPAGTQINGAVQSRQSNTYTPSYNQQRSTNRSNYNVQGYSRPSTSSGNENVTKSATTPSYSRPSSSSSTERSYRSGSTYNRSSSTGTNPSRSTYSAPSGNSNSGGSYSSPSRSSSGSTYSAPSSSGSSGGNSGGGSSSGSSSSSSHSGRR